MDTTFRRIDLMRAALQVKGASAVEIEEFVIHATRLGGSRFDDWNKPLNDDEIKLLTCILSEGGIPYANIVIEGFLEKVTTRFGISREEISANLKARIDGLN